VLYRELTRQITVRGAESPAGSVSIQPGGLNWAKSDTPLFRSSGGQGALNQHLFKVTSEEYPKWLCYLGVHLHLEGFRRIAAGKATTMVHIQRHHLADARLAIPPQDLLKAMDGIMQPIVEASRRYAVEYRTSRRSAGHAATETDLGATASEGC
jgi:hypothetical protein